MVKGRDLDEVYSTTLAPVSQEHHRNDHAQIFPLLNGDLLVVWSEYYVRRPSVIHRLHYGESLSKDNAPCQITGRVSRDAGRTWSGRITIQENIGADNVKHPNLLRLPSGEVLFFFTLWDMAAQARSVWMRRSSDDCESWTPPRQITPPGGNYILDAGRVLLHSSGRVVLPIYWAPELWTEKDHLEAFCYYSNDQGESWHWSRNRMRLPGRGAMEPAIVERKDGSLFVVLRSNLGELYQAESADCGETWSEPGASGITAPQSESCLKRIRSTGDLLLLWNHTLPYALTRKSSSVTHHPRNPLTAALSRDEGRSWENIRNIENRVGYSSAYPNVLFHKDEALITYYHCSEATHGVASLELKIFKVDWFYEGETDQGSVS